MKRRSASADIDIRDKYYAKIIMPPLHDFPQQYQYSQDGQERQQQQPLHYRNDNTNNTNNTNNKSNNKNNNGSTSSSCNNLQEDWSMQANPQSAPECRRILERSPSTCSTSSTSLGRLKKSWDVNTNGTTTSVLVKDNNYVLRRSSSSILFCGGRNRNSCNSSTDESGKPLFKSTFSLAVMGFCMVGLTLYCSSRANLMGTLSEVSDLLWNAKLIHSQLRDTRKRVRIFQRELSALDMMQQQQEDLETERMIRDQAAEFTRQSDHHSSNANARILEDMNALQRRIRKSSDHLDHLQQQITVINKKDLTNRYGHNPIRVKLQLIFPESASGQHAYTRAGNNDQKSKKKSGRKGVVVVDHDDDAEPPNTSIIFEMAPVDLMPHSVHTFLEMISYGLFDGCSFILNALHIVKAAPLPYDGSPAYDKVQAFNDLGLESVAFREYSSKFPHQKYTVGFVADGSPSFYINTEDNTEIHVGDPCFAKIVSGFETVERIANSPTRNGIWLEERIGIKKVTILPSFEEHPPLKTS